MEITLGGVVQTSSSQMVWQSDTRDAAACGLRQRYQAFWEAVARFLNCGGTYDEAREALSGLDPLLTSEFRVPEPFVLALTMQKVSYVRHVFFNPNVSAPGAAIDWVEDRAIVERTMQAVIDEAKELGDASEHNDFPDL